jgi:plasmid stabilization system protein ParE
MKRINWSEGAIADLESTLEYISLESPQNAALVKNRIMQSLKNLEFFDLGTPAPNGTFKLYLPKTSYFVIFRKHGQDAITLCAFIHSSRDWEKFNWDKLV